MELRRLADSNIVMSLSLFSHNTHNTTTILIITIGRRPKGVANLHHKKAIFQWGLAKLMIIISIEQKASKLSRFGYGTG